MLTRTFQPLYVQKSPKSIESDIIFLIMIITILTLTTMLFMIIKISKDYQTATPASDYELTDTPGEVV